MDMKNNDQSNDIQQTPQETEPISIPPEAVAGSEPPSEQATEQKQRKTHWILYAVIFLILALVLGAYFGYRNGIARRLEKEKTTVVQVAAEQYQLAFQDIAVGNYETAKTRIEYVIKIYPQFPGAPELLHDILLNLEQPTAMPTPIAEFTPTPAVTSTPDFRAAEQIFTEIQQAVAAKQWDQAIQDIIAIREVNYDYRKIQVDGFYYIALRNRGIQRIQSGQLEQGLFDLATAEQFAPLDGEADGVRSWAQLYLSGASYWDVNWQRAIDIFAQVKDAYPYLMDSSGMTAIERYRVALYLYGDQFAASGDYCKAHEYYLQSLAVGPDANVQATAQRYAEACQAMQATPEPTEELTPIPTEQTPLPPTEPTPEQTPTAIETPQP
jgi:tetratricopeptide (TPR) repeat protein